MDAIKQVDAAGLRALSELFGVPATSAFYEYREDFKEPDICASGVDLGTRGRLTVTFSDGRTLELWTSEWGGISRT